MAFAMKREIKGSIRSQSKRRIIALAIGFEVIAFSAFDTAWKILNVVQNVCRFCIFDSTRNIENRLIDFQDD